MKRLIRLLQLAHAIEIGAYNAYEGHWNSIPANEVERIKIWVIQCEEYLHREELKKMLRKLDAKPSKILDAILWVIGKSISVSCYVMPRKMAMWGAEIMEIMGSGIYYRVAEAALDEDQLKMCHDLVKMGRQEERHEQFFRKYLNK